MKNPMAKDLRQPKYKQRVVPDKKKPVSKRKEKHKKIMTPKKSAQLQAEKTFKQFVDMSVRGTIVIILVLIFIGLISDWESPTPYNGEVYSPKNVGDY